MERPTDTITGETAEPVEYSINFERLPNLNLDELEVSAIREAIRRHPDSPSEAAKLLGISRWALNRKKEKFGIITERPPRPPKEPKVAREPGEVRLPPKRTRGRKTPPEPTGPVGEAPSEMVFSGLPDETGASP